MKKQSFKKIAGSLLSAAIVVSNLGLVPTVVLADPIQDQEGDFEFDKVYHIEVDDYKQLNDYLYYSFEITPSVSGYYFVEIVGDSFNIMESIENDDGSLSYKYASWANITVIDMPWLIESYSHTYCSYYLEEGHTYYLVSYSSELNECDFDIRYVDKYVKTRNDDYTITAIKDEFFTYDIGLESSVPLDGITYSWTFYINNEISYECTTSSPEITLNSSEVFDFDVLNETDTLYGYCSFYIPYGEYLYNYYHSSSFSVKAYNSQLDAYTWANVEDYHYSDYLPYHEPILYNSSFVVDAGCELDCECNISYQWYVVDSIKFHSNDYVNLKDICTVLPNETNNYFDLQNANDLLGEPYLFIEHADDLSLLHDLVCVVTFENDKEKTEKDVFFRIDYSTSVNLESYYYYSNSPIIVEQGDSVLLPYEGSFNESDLPDGLSYKYTWINCKYVPDSSSICGYGNTNVWEYYIDGEYSLIGEGNTLSIDTSDLYVFDDDDQKYSYVACVYEPLYNGEVCKNNSLYTGVYFFKIVYQSFESSIWAEGGNSWSSCKIPYNNNGYDNRYESFHVYAGSSMNCDIYYQWYEKDGYKEASGDYESEDEILIPLENQNNSSLYLSDVLHDPYIIWDGDTCDMYIDYVCKVTFDNGSRTIEKSFDYRATFITDVSYGYCNNIDIRFDKTKSITLPECDSFVEGDKPEGITYNYTWVSLKDYSDNCRSNAVCYGERVDVYSNLGAEYDVLGFGESITVNTASLNKTVNADGSTVSWVACVYEPMYNGSRCYGRSMECGYVIYKLIDNSTIPFGEDSIWAYCSSNVLGTPYHCDAYPKFDIIAGSYSDCEISYQWYWIDSDKELSGDYEEETDLYVLLEGQTDALIHTYDVKDYFGEPYLYIDDNGNYNFCHKFVCVVTFNNGKETIQKTVPVQINYYIDTYLSIDYKDYCVDKYGDTVYLPEVNYYSDSPDLPEGFSYKLTWANCNSIPWTDNYTQYPYNDKWGYWDSLTGDCNVIASGSNVGINTSELSLYKYDEGYCSYIALMLEPYYNGEVCNTCRFSRSFYVIKLYYSDLIEPNDSCIAINSTNFPDSAFRQYIIDNYDRNNSGYLNWSEIDAVDYMYIDNLGISDLSGIQYFSYLRKLDCSYNNLSSLNNISGLDYLEKLYCNNNNLSSLDVSDLDNLMYLYCYNNSITELVLPDNFYLRILDCHSNGLTSLDLSGRKYLSCLDCSDNYLTNLNLSGCKALYQAYINNNNLSSISLDDCNKLKLKYENGPYTLIKSGVSGYGTIELSEEFDRGYWLDEGLIIDNSTIVLNATPYRPEDYSGVDILTQPKDYIGTIGDNATFTVSAIGDDLTYQWQILKSGVWKNTSLPGANSDTLTVGILDSRNGMQFRCVIKNSSGGKEISEVATLIVEFINITSQPSNFNGPVGVTANFDIEAEGNGLTYQWQVYKNGVWKNTSLPGATSDSLSVGIVESRDGMQFRCVIKDTNGNILFSDTATLTVDPTAITSQPSDYTGAVGDTATFTVAAEGENLKYQWQVYKNGAWKNTSLPGATTDTLSVGIIESRNGMSFRCVITSQNGTVMFSDPAKLTVEPITITVQPEDYIGSIGETAEFYVGAEGENLKYQWQVYKNGAWKNTSLPGATTNTLSVGIIESRNGMSFRCVITSQNGTVLFSDSAILTIEPLTITVQPEDQTGSIGETVEFSVEAEGEGLTYQWQVYKNGAWKNTSLPGATTDTLSVEAINSRNGMKFRCVVTDINGTSVASNEAIVTVGAKPVTITTEPEDYSGPVGDIATFEIKAEGEDLSYQWQVYKNGAWKNTSLPGNTTSSIDVEITDARDGMTFRCVVTDGSGNKAISEEATITVSAVQNTIKIKTQPESAEKAEGDTVIFNIEAEGEDLTYQWQVYKNGVWKNTSIMGNNTPSLIVDVLASRNGMKFRCVVTDVNGFTETSDEVTITVK